MALSVRLPGVAFVARLHRGDSQAHYERLAAEVPGNRLVVVRHDAPGFPVDILEWLQGCSVLLTGASAVATEAMLLDVPVVTMDFTGDYRGIDFIQVDATTHITDEVALLDSVGRLVSSEPARLAARARAQGFLDDYFFRRDRQSAQRCATAIRALGKRPVTKSEEEHLCAASQGW
jgi:hypothetical protein